MLQLHPYRFRKALICSGCSRGINVCRMTARLRGGQRKCGWSGVRSRRRAVLGTPNCRQNAVPKYNSFARCGIDGFEETEPGQAFAPVNSWSPAANERRSGSVGREGISATFWYFSGVLSRACESEKRSDFARIGSLQCINIPSGQHRTLRFPDSSMLATPERRRGTFYPAIRRRGHLLRVGLLECGVG